MNVLVVSDAHIWKSESGKYWCNTAMHGYGFWTRYLSAFESVTIVARVANIKEDEALEQNYIRADGENVYVYELPFIRGLKGYIFNFFKMIKAAKRASQAGDCAVFRLPSIPAYMMLFFYKKRKRPYAIEVVIDPEDEYGSYKLIKKISVCLLKRCCGEADGVSYVTQHYLQGKYPSGYKLGKKNKNYFESFYSSIDLKKDFFYSERTYSEHENHINIIHVANSINNYNKGHKVLLDVVSRLKENGIIAKVTFIGSGDLIETFKNYAKTLEINDQVVFTGYVSGKKVIREYLIKSDLFVFPTKAEGLPRALIEAMATALPCLSSNVDGIPELLDEEYLFNYDDVDGFSKKIISICSDAEKLKRMGMKNFETAKFYESSILSERRKKFYSQLKEITKNI